MAQSIKVDIRGDAGSLVKALKQSETAMRRLQAATKGLAAQDKLTNSAAVALTAALQRNAAAMETRTSAITQNTNATRVNTSANEDLGGSLQRTNARLGQANAGFYNIGFAIEDAGQFANGFSAGMRAIGNNLSAIALSLSASGATFAQFGAFLAGPGGLIIAISAFTAAAQLVPALMDKIGSSADTAGSSLSGFVDSIDDVSADLPSLEDDLDSIKSAFEELIKLRTQVVELEEVDLVNATAMLSSLEDETRYLESQRFFAKDILQYRGLRASEEERSAAIQAAINRYARDEVISAEELNYLSTLERETLERIISGNEQRLGLLTTEADVLREKISAEEDSLAAIEYLEKRGYVRVEQAEETADAEEETTRQVRFQLPLKEKMLQEQAELNRLVKEETNLERIRSRMATQRLLDMTLEPPPEIDSFASAFDRVQERIAFADSTLKQLGVTTDTAKDRFAILADQIENAFDRGIISFQEFQELLAQAEFSIFGGEEVDSEEEKIEAQTQRLRSALEAGMANMAVGILSGEQSVSSAFGSFFAMMGNQLIQLGIANIGLGTAGEALRAFVTNPALAIAAGATLLAIGGQLRKRTRNAQTNITSGRGGSISTGSAFVRDPYALSNQRNPFFGGGGTSPFNVGYIAPPPPPSNPYAEIRMDAKDFVVSFDDARRELDMVS